MAYYKVDKSVDAGNTHHVLIIPPLAIILVSCFLFVLVQPHAPKVAAPTASYRNKPAQIQPQLTLPMAQTSSLPLIDPVVVEKNTSSVPGNIATTTPQPTVSSVSSLQSAVTNNQQSLTAISVPHKTTSKKTVETTTKDKDSDSDKKTNFGKRH